MHGCELVNCKLIIFAVCEKYVTEKNYVLKGILFLVYGLHCRQYLQNGILHLPSLKLTFASVLNIRVWKYVTTFLFFAIMWNLNSNFNVTLKQYFRNLTIA